MDAGSFGVAAVTGKIAVEGFQEALAELRGHLARAVAERAPARPSN